MKTKNIIILGMVFLIVILIIFGLNHSIQLKETYEEEIKNHESEMDNLKKIHEEKIASMSAIDYSPTLNEVMEVVRNNNIENKEYDDETFACVEFSNNLVRAFQEDKIYSCAVELWFEDGAHALVVANTSDKGIIYIEPQDDTIIYDLNIGDDYCEKVDWDCDWTITHIKSCYF